MQTEASAVSAGTELAVWTGTHQWLKDPNLPDWKFPFRPGYSAAGRVVAVGSAVSGWKPGDRVSYPGNHASHELLTLGHERGRLWRLPDELDAAAGRPGLHRPLRHGRRHPRRHHAGPIGRRAGPRHHRPVRPALPAGRRAHPVVGIDGVHMRRDAALAAGADHVIDPTAGDVREQLDRRPGDAGAEIVADATGIPDAVPVAMSLACDGGQVVVVGSPRGKAKDVNFYDDLHRRYIEVTGAHGNMLFEPAHTRLAGAWDINKAQTWLLAEMAANRLSLDGLVTHRIRPQRTGDGVRGVAQEEGGVPGRGGELVTIHRFALARTSAKR